MNLPQFTAQTLYNATEHFIEDAADVHHHNKLLDILRMKAIGNTTKGLFSASLDQHDTVGITKGTEHMLVRTLKKKGFTVSVSQGLVSGSSCSIWIKWEKL